ncbi:outer membrane beta-barrel protein [Mariniflexile sp. AS56]|uniref:outer membrane beta-barrel protein n=1 Tax=Mariniflexile sp. AS56 TaxID=3063957 RepID=UPI0026F2E7CA|nr:outer membrane beta-barrel protein [Mariniflexile sp. AS56]MDO7172135.1 outer membrane beta-barrel protein [Mariniflexile sp. AS56]
MKKLQLILLVTLMLCFVTKSFAQKGNYRISNGISITGAITKLDITTDNFITKQGEGFLGGFDATVDIPHRWYNVSFGMQLSESAIGISARPEAVLGNSEFIDYKLFAAQVALLMHIKVIPDHFTIDLGPMLQYNSKMELKDRDKENYYIDKYANLSAEAISEISQFNFNGAVGASVGFRNFKLKAQYIYGLTNILKKLENQDLDTTGGDARFKGNQNMLVLGAKVSF